MLAQTGKVGVLRRPAGEVTGSPADAFAQLVERAVRQTGACEGAGDVVANAAVVRRDRERALCLRDTRLHLAAVHEPDGEKHAGECVVRMVPQVGFACAGGARLTSAWQACRSARSSSARA